MKGRKPNASGGIAGQLHLNQGGVAWPAGRERFSEEWNLIDAYKEMLDTRLLAVEDSSTPPDKMDEKSINMYIKYLEEQGVDTNSYRDRFEKQKQKFKKLQEPLAPVPETRSADRGLSNILRV